jgi:hypothetical protein
MPTLRILGDDHERRLFGWNPFVDQQIAIKVGMSGGEDDRRDLMTSSRNGMENRGTNNCQSSSLQTGTEGQTRGVLRRPHYWDRPSPSNSPKLR